MESMLKIAIESGDAEHVRAVLASNPSLANEPIEWFKGQTNISDPLHYVSDCVGGGTITDRVAADMASLLIGAGANVNGNDGRESPLIGAVSLGAERVARAIADAGADVRSTSGLGETALHWAAWMGLSDTVRMLIENGSEIERRCREFGATPLFWAIHGFGHHGTEVRDQIGAAKLLLAAGANLETSNKDGTTALDLAAGFADKRMYEALCQARKQ